jgi:hypothetical protein
MGKKLIKEYWKEIVSNKMSGNQMIKKIFIVILITAQCFCGYTFTVPPVPYRLIVCNTENDGIGSLRSAILGLNRQGAMPQTGLCGIVFEIPGFEHPHITLESDIIIEAGPVTGVINTNEINKTVTIEGSGWLIFKTSKIKLANNIVRIMHPKSLVDLAVKVVCLGVKAHSIKELQLHYLPLELKEKIYMRLAAKEQQKEHFQKNKSTCIVA